MHDNAYNIFSTAQVASELSISPRRVRALARSRHLGTKLGRIWIFTQADIEAMRERKPGKPPLPRV